MCERIGCPQRAFPPVGRSLMVDERQSLFSPYAASKPRDEWKTKLFISLSGYI
ncbi:short-chain fatty acyl-CoA regulator family protein [Bradyrhizobium sp. CCBAU 45389]|uniref:short-chain fatty acyl-CoA regulator family protein n=1 Tax=Bradyrhizobium sp. CCBAU 45389 TaxID=858429 RepID=UPI0023057A68|nr:short-chain fatty acyl-CoA regulator family protein [Bradyrhizobium sp. CCBAU 45389]